MIRRTMLWRLVKDEPTNSPIFFIETSAPKLNNHIPITTKAALIEKTTI